MQKKKFCKDLVIGEAFEQEPFLLQSIGSLTSGQLRVTLSDRTGSVQCNVPEQFANDLSLYEQVGQVVKVSAVVFAEKRLPLLVVKSIAMATDFLPAEVFSGISQEKKDEFISLIKDAIAKVKTPSYKALLDACLTDVNLSKLGGLPATHGYYGAYVGGALAATCTVTYMVMSATSSYVKRGNGITTAPPGWNVLLTASLLHAFGRIEYCDANDPFKKSARGVSMNYFSTLQHSIESVIFKENIPISEVELASLLNVLAVAVAGKTDTKAVSKDGSILRSILYLYGECDAIDYQVANHTAEDDEEYFYSRKLKRYLVTEREEE